MDIDGFTNILLKIFPYTIRKTTDQYSISIPTKLNKDEEIEAIASISLNELEEIISVYNSIEISEGKEAIIFNNCYETIAIENIYSPILIAYEKDKYEYLDEAHGLVYRFNKKLSPYFIIHYLNELFLNYSENKSRIRISRFSIRRAINENRELALFDVLSFGMQSGIQIESKKSLPFQTFENLCYSFIFQIGFNLDIPIRKLKNLEELITPDRIQKFKRNNLEKMDPPKRIYNSNLISHYQMGLHSDNIAHQYLSYYHVIEFFYYSIFNDEIVREVRKKLTDPKFSYSEDKDIQNLLKFMKKEINQMNKETDINEIKSLELTLRKYISNIDDFAFSISEYDPNIIEYYKKNQVSFSKGPCIDFLSSNHNEIYKNLSNRIYKTRNAIVHSKDSDRERYQPFEHESELIREIPLIRFIAEQIIIGNSDVLPNEIK